MVEALARGDLSEFKEQAQLDAQAENRLRVMQAEHDKATAALRDYLTKRYRSSL